MKEGKVYEPLNRWKKLLVVMGLSVLLLIAFKLQSDMLPGSLTVEQVMEHGEYKLAEKEADFGLKGFVKPEWLATAVQPEVQVDRIVAEGYHSKIRLLEVTLRDESLFLHFHTAYELSRGKGQFLSPSYLGANKPDSSAKQAEVRFPLFDGENQPIEALGSVVIDGADFTIEIPQEQAALVRQGLFVEFSAMPLYAYSTLKL